MEVLDAQIWTQWRVRTGSFLKVVQGRSRSGSCGGGQPEISKKAKKGRKKFKATATPTHNVFRHSELDTLASSARRIFLSRAIVQGRSKTQFASSQNPQHTLSFLPKRLAHFARSPCTFPSACRPSSRPLLFARTRPSQRRSMLIAELSFLWRRCLVLTELCRI